MTSGVYYGIPFTSTNTYKSTICIPHLPFTVCTCLEINDTGLGIQADVVGCCIGIGFIYPQCLYVKIES